MRPHLPACMLLALLAGSVGSAQNAELVIAGCVRDSVTGSPIQDIRLALNTVRGTLHQQYPGKTDSLGNFRFEKLAEGEYQLSLTRVGYVGSNYSEGKTERIRAGAGINSQELNLRLTPTAALQGRVLDALGHPVSGAYLYAERQNEAFPANSEKDGSFHFENLPPGSYRIAVRVPYAAREKTIERDPETGAIYGYPNSQYYPGVDDPLQAGTVALTGGERLDGFDIRLRRRLLVELSGQVVDGVTRDRLEAGEVELASVPGGLTDKTYSRRRLEGENAGFRFDLLTPGSYALLIYRNHTKDASPYVHPVDIGTGGMTDLRISVPSFGSVTGRLIVPEGAKTRSPFIVRFALQHTPSREATAGPDGSFVLDNMPPGRWSVGVTWSNFGIDPQGPQDLYVASIRQNGITGPVTVGEGVSAPIEIELSDQVGQVFGMVSDDNQHPFAYALVIMTGDRLYRVTTNEEGRFTAKLPPGSYSVSAFTGVATMSGLPADKTRACRDRMAKLKVTAGESSFARLEVCRH